MAPSNLNQVFVVNNVTMLTGSTFATSAATANASKFGIWNIDASTVVVNLTNANTTSLGTTVTVTSTAGLIAGMTIVKTSGTGTIPAATVSSVTNATQFVLSAAPSVDLAAATLSATTTVSGGAFTTAPITDLKRVQFVQSTVGAGLLASPIIDVADIVRINYNEYDSTTTNPSVRPQVRKAVIDASAAAANATSGSDPIMMRIAVRTSPTAYEYFANNGNPNADLSFTGSGTSYAFPLLGNFSAGRMIFNIEVPESVHSPSATYNEATLITALYNGIQNNPTLKAIFAATDNGASGLELVARHYGVMFDVTLSQNGVTQGTVTMSMVNSASASNYILAISDEKRQRARYGNFNRMYFPVTQVDYAQPTYKYDVLEITYKHGHPADTGIARAAELNTLKVYFGSSSTALAAATDFRDAFSIVIGTNEEQITDIALQS